MNKQKILLILELEDKMNAEMQSNKQNSHFKKQHTYLHNMDGRSDNSSNYVSA
jgi:hypothetical protein